MALDILFVVVVADPVLYMHKLCSFVFALLVPQAVLWFMTMKATSVSISHNSAAMQPKPHADRSCNLREPHITLKLWSATFH